MVDMLLFWVTVGFLVETTRTVVKKCCVERRKKEKAVSSLREPLLKPEEMLDASGHCRMSCCSHQLENDYSHEELEEEYLLREASEEESDSLAGLRAITDESEEDLQEQGVKIIKWEDFRHNVSMTLFGDKMRSLKGKEIIQELEGDTTHSNRPRSEIIPSRIRRESRGKNSAKIYPEPLDAPLTSLQAPDYHFMHEGQSSSDYGLKIYDQSSSDHHFKADTKLPTGTGECSKS